GDRHDGRPRFPPDPTDGASGWGSRLCGGSWRPACLGRRLHRLGALLGGEGQGWGPSRRGDVRRGKSERRVRDREWDLDPTSNQAAALTLQGAGRCLAASPSLAVRQLRESRIRPRSAPQTLVAPPPADEEEVTTHMPE